MAKFFLRKSSETLQIARKVIKWLAGLLQLTEDERQDAGIYSGNQR
jgi:hypothetical protein